MTKVRDEVIWQSSMQTMYTQKLPEHLRQPILPG